jgi:hypothetical protein
MILFFTCVYVALLFVAEKLKIIRFNLFWKTSPLIVFFLLNVGLFIPMGWGAGMRISRRRLVGVLCHGTFSILRVLDRLEPIPLALVSSITS